MTPAAAVHDDHGPLPSSPAVVIVRVRRATVPLIAPDHLVEIVRPIVLDDGGVDWELVSDTLLRAGAVRTYWEWRATWERTHRLGTVPAIIELAAMIRFLAQVRDPNQIAVGGASPLADLLEEISRLRPYAVDLRSEQIPPLLAELDDLERCLEIAEGTGFAIVDDHRRPGSHLHVWSPLGGERNLDTHRRNQLITSSRGLHLLVGSANQAPKRFDLGAVDLTGPFASARDPQGTAVPLDDELCRLLAGYAPGTLRWHVESIPLSGVWSSTILGLRAAVSAGRIRATDVHASA